MLFRSGLLVTSEGRVPRQRCACGASSSGRRRTGGDGEATHGGWGRRRGGEAGGTREGNGEANGDDQGLAAPLGMTMPAVAMVLAMPISASR